MLAHNLRDLGYQSTRADPSIWINLITRPDGRGYYELVLIYVDDILHVHHDTNNFMNNIKYIYKLKYVVG